ncbi:MAG: dicarboxylate/amino acid:cation symporter [Planctomycetota bacterium]|jgi:proton glutamate symport protein
MSGAETGRKALHWWILGFMAIGVIVGATIQSMTEGPGSIGAKVVDAEGGVRVESIRTSLLPKGRKPTEALAVGDVISALVLDKGVEGRERRIAVESAAGLRATLDEVGYGMVASLERVGGAPRSVTLELEPTSSRNSLIEPFRFVADIFMRLLKMLIVPLVLTSIITGVTGLGGGSDFGRLGRRTLGYYIMTSLLAAGLGLLLVNVIRPGEGAELGLAVDAAFGSESQNLWDIFRRMVPENVFSAFSANGQMLQIIFFALLFGYFITRSSDTTRATMTQFFEAAFEVVMRLAQAVMLTVPVGVLCLLVKVVGETGFGVFKPLAWYMLTVFLALVIHAGVVLPMLVRFVGGVNPLRWAKAMSPALMTAFSTSSSSMTLPVTLETIEERGKVSNKVSSFVAPLGSTVNMDGTALYECIGVIFLAQYYASTGNFEFGFTQQVYVVIAALLASIGAAGIPSAGLVMMLTILSALELPLEGAALLLAVDRPLDMCRTVVNVWSDTCGTAVIASREGETPLGEAVAAAQT